MFEIKNWKIWKNENYLELKVMRYRFRKYIPLYDICNIERDEW